MVSGIRLPVDDLLASPYPLIMLLAKSDKSLPGTKSPEA